MAEVIRRFYILSPLAGLLLVPYFGWLVYATVLNTAICKLNPTDQYGYSNARLQADLTRMKEATAKSLGM